MPKSSQICLHVSHLERSIQDSCFLGHSPWNNVQDNSTDHITCFQSSDVQDLWCSHHLFRLLAFFFFSNQSLTNCSSTVDVEFPKLPLDCFCGNRVFKINTEFCCHLLRNSSMIFRHNPLQRKLSLSLSFGFRPLFLFPSFVYAVITLEIALLNTPNEVAVFGYRCSS